MKKKKSEVGTVLKIFNSTIQTQFQTKIKVFRSKNVKDYFKSILGEYLMSHGIVHQSSCVDTPQQNKVTKRKTNALLKWPDLLCSPQMFLNIFWVR